MLFSLAHEIGHAKTLYACAKEFGYTRAIVQDNSFSGRESEFRAWCVADNLIKKLGLFGSTYAKYKHACLRTYYVQA